MNKWVKRVLKIIAGIIISLLIVILGLYFWIQTDAFNNWALEFTLDKLNQSFESKDNKINAESLNGNILNGVTLNKGSVLIKEDSLLSFDFLEVKYDLWGLLKQQINLEYVILRTPKINLAKVKGTDSLIWNFTTLFSSSKEKDTSITEFDWDVSVKKLKIENGSVKIFGNEDSLPVRQREISRSDSFDYNNLDISNLEMDLSAEYFKDHKNLNLNNFSFNTNSDFSIKKLIFNAAINHKDSTTDISGMELITNRSDIKIDKLMMYKFNPFDSIIYSKFGDKDLIAKINIEKFNFADLKFFIPSLAMLDSVVSLKLDADGKYGDLQVNDLELHLPNSVINLKGNVKNLQDPSLIYFDVYGKDIKIDPRDINLVYNVPLIPDYSNLGIVNADLSYKGTLENFNSDFNIKSDAGLIDGSVNLNSEYESYSGFLNTHNINLGKILRDKKYNSSINMNTHFTGNKFNLKYISLNMEYSIYNSNFSGYNIILSSGKIHASGNNIGFNVLHRSSMGNVSAGGRINISNMNNPVYSVKGKVNNLDVSKFTKKADDKSNLNFTFDINGRGSSIQNINGKYDIHLGTSFYSTYKIPETQLNVEINNSGEQNKIKVLTDMLEFNVDGRFTMQSLFAVLQKNTSSFMNSITKKLNPDSVLYSAEVNQGYENSSTLDLKYDLIVKDTTELQILNPFGINFLGKVSGNISNNSDGFNTDALIDVESFVYNDTAIILHNVHTDFSFKNDYSTDADNTMSPYALMLKTSGDKILFQSNSFDSVFLDADLKNSVMEINLRARQDTTNSASLAGRINILPDKMIADFDSISLMYGKYKIFNDKNWILNYYPEGKVNFEQFALKSKNTVLNVKGDFSIYENSDMTIQSDIKPEEIMEILDSLNTEDPVKGNINLSINYKGNLENPDLNVKINSDNIEYKDTKVGTVVAAIDYKDEIAHTDIKLENKNKKGNLKIEGQLPVRNPLSDKDTSSYSPEFLNNPVDIKFIADNFELKYFTKLIPGLPDISGIMNGQILTNGTVSAPQLKGDMKITDGTTFVDYTGMDYKYNLVMSTANSKLKIDKLSLSNVQDDSKHFDISGTVDFTGLKINDINLTTSGDMVLLDENAERNKIGIEGYFLGGVGGNPITIKGNLKKLDITGEFLVKDATISSLPTNSTGYDFKDDNFIYTDDSRDTGEYIEGTIYLEDPDDIYKIDPFRKDKYIVATSNDSESILNLDLRVKTEKNIYVSIDFNNVTRDRLFGEITADLKLKTENNKINAYGSVDVVKDSYYRFYRNFKIKNSHITFNGPIDNPQLDVQAVYEGTKTTEQFGATSNYPVEVRLTLKGTIDTPKVDIKLSEDGSEVSGNDAQADAVTFLLFGKYKSELSTSERKTVATSVGTTLGSLYITSIISQTVREILPFLVDAEFNYSDGNVKNTDVELTSEFGEVTVRVGGKLLKEVKNVEFSVDYPINKLLNLNLPESLIMEISREESTNGGTGNTQSVYTTGIKIAYKIKF